MVALIVFGRRSVIVVSKRAAHSSGGGIRKVVENKHLLPRVANDQFLHKGVVKFESPNGRLVELNTVWQDNMPSGSSVGTVVALHGSPGSHNDFKYIEHFLRPKNIRLISLNYPGFGFTENTSDLEYDNDERDNFVTAMIEKLKIDNKVLWLGHSRGNENAFRCAVLHKDISLGSVLVNPTGFKIHKGVRPHFVIKIASWADKNDRLRHFFNPLTRSMYSMLGLKTGSADIAAVCVRTMSTFSFERMRETVEQFNKIPHLQTFVCYAGKDFLIEEEITREFFETLACGEERVFPRSTDDEEQASAFALPKLEKGIRAVGVCFKEDGHFLQKYRSRLIADGIETMIIRGSTKL